MQNLAESLSSAIPVLLGGFLTGIFALAAAFINSRAIASVDKSSHKREILIVLEAEVLAYTKQSDDFNGDYIEK